MLFAMVERGMDAEVQGDKGKLRANPTSNDTSPSGTKGVEALWAVLLTKELWRKGVWNDGKSVSIVSLGCFHPVAKVQSASLHFFLGEEDDDEDSESEDEGPNIKAMMHQRGVKKKTKSGEKKIAKAEKAIKKVRSCPRSVHLLTQIRNAKTMLQRPHPTFLRSSCSMTPKHLAKSCTKESSDTTSAIHSSTSF